MCSEGWQALPRRRFRADPAEPHGQGGLRHTLTSEQASATLRFSVWPLSKPSCAADQPIAF